MNIVIQESYYHFLDNFIRKHLDLLSKSRVMIFGAGTRGINVLWMLKYNKIKNIYFVDNNQKKQGEEIEGIDIISFEKAQTYTGRTVYLCPVEKGESILSQLRGAGYEENIDYFNLDFFFTEYQDIITQIKGNNLNYSILFGCCILSSWIMGKDQIEVSLGKRIQQEFSQQNWLVFSLPGLNVVEYYHLLNIMKLLQKEKPRMVCITLEMSSMSPYAPLMVGTQNLIQHKMLFESLIKLEPQNIELQEHLRTIESRLQKSKSGRNLTSADNTPEAKRKVYELKYLYNLRESDEAVVYTKKILEQMNRENIPVVLLSPPVDYMTGKKICGPDFNNRYIANIQKLKNFLDGYRFISIDASFLAMSDMFVPQDQAPNINPFLNYEGQKCLIDFIKMQLR